MNVAKVEIKLREKKKKIRVSKIMRFKKNNRVEERKPQLD